MWRDIQSADVAVVVQAAMRLRKIYWKLKYTIDMWSSGENVNDKSRHWLSLIFRDEEHEQWKVSSIMSVVHIYDAATV